MELKDFVKQTLVDIGEAMQQAHNELTEKKGKGIDDINYTEIKFDIALGIDQTSSTHEGGKLNVFSVGSAGIEKGDSLSNSQQNRIQFSIKFHVETAGRKFAPVAF